MPSRPKLREPFTYFLDRCLGDEIVPERLRQAGFSVVLHRDRFRDDAPDEEWLGQLEPTLVLLTKDKRIRTNQLEREALLSTGLASFMLGSGQLSGAAMAEAFVAGKRSMERALRRLAPPFIATVSPQGRVSILYDGAGALATPPIIR